MDWQAAIQALRADNISGAAEIARHAVAAMQQWLAQMSKADFEHWRAELMVFGRQLYVAQPAMAPLFHLVNDALSAIDSAASVAEAEGRARRVTQTFLQQLDQAPAQLLAAA